MMQRLYLFIDGITQKLLGFTVLLAVIGFAIGYLIIIIPLSILSGLSFILKLLNGEGYNEMAFDTSHPDFDINNYLMRGTGRYVGK